MRKMVIIRRGGRKFLALLSVALIVIYANVRLSGSHLICGRKRGVSPILRTEHFIVYLNMRNPREPFAVCGWQLLFRCEQQKLFIAISTNNR